MVQRGTRGGGGCWCSPFTNDVRHETNQNTATTVSAPLPHSPFPTQVPPFLPPSSPEPLSMVSAVLAQAVKRLACAAGPNSTAREQRKKRPHLVPLNCVNNNVKLKSAGPRMPQEHSLRVIDTFSTSPPPPAPLPVSVCCNHSRIGMASLSLQNALGLYAFCSCQPVLELQGGFCTCQQQLTSLLQPHTHTH